MSRSAYADMYGPTVGDKVRLADTELFVEVEKDFTVYGEEVKFGGGKVIRDGQGQSQLLAHEVVDTLITNALIIDHWGIVKADVGLKNGRIHAIGKAGYIALLSAITMVIVAGHGDNEIVDGLWRAVNVLVGIAIALAFSFALPLYATYSWRYKLADALRACAAVHA
ncbi:hypothetical protein SB816_29770, partial [Achromobacter sp. SIMBA_011]